MTSKLLLLWQTGARPAVVRPIASVGIMLPSIFELVGILMGIIPDWLETRIK